MSTEPTHAGGVRQRILEVLKDCYDPEIPVNIYELGLIYGVEIDERANVVISMTLTSPACPVAGTLPGEVEARVRQVPGVEDARIDLVWEPPWSPDRMSEAARLELGLD